MHTLYRNLLSVVRRFRMATVLNVLGLAVAFAAFMVMMMQVDFDRTFDTSDPNHARIFRLEVADENGTLPIHSRPMAETFFASSPHIVAGTYESGAIGEVFVVGDSTAVGQAFEEQTMNVSPGFADVFTFDFVEGSKEALRTPNHVMIPQSMAHKMFGRRSAIGQQLRSRSPFRKRKHKGECTLTVGAVYRDFPAGTLVGNVIYEAILDDENKTRWNNFSYQVFVRVDDAANAPSIIAHFKKQKFDDKVKDQVAHLRLTPLHDVHFITDAQFDDTPKADPQTLRVLVAIAVVVIVIAGINFTNFSMALTPMRIRSINTQKVLGSTLGTIRRALVAESVLMSMAAYLIALGLVDLFAKSPLSSLVQTDLNFLIHLPVTILTALLALLTGIVAGLYPAYYMTSFPPALVLKGNFGLSPRGHALRNALIGIQFFASFALIISAGFISLQNHYMQHAPLGYDRDALIVTNLSDVVKKRQSAFTDRLKANAGIADVTYGERLLSSADFYMSWGTEFRGEDISFHVLPVDPSFLDVMGIKITEGRSFRDEDARTRHGAYVFNEMARQQFGLEPGLMIDSIEVVGFMPDVKFASFRTEVVPMAFYVWGTKNRNNFLPGYAYIKVKAGSDMRAAMQHVLATLKEFDPEYSFNVRFFDEVLQQLYEKERAVGSLITLFSAMAVFISIVGVFGLVLFDSEYRRKEIGIRKVFGSSTRQILTMFSRTYLRIVAVCFVIAAPVAYYGVTRWLEHFAYRTPLRWWVFVLSFVAVTAVTLATVTFQNWRAANTNPVKSLRSE